MKASSEKRLQVLSHAGNQPSQKTGILYVSADLNQLCPLNWFSLQRVKKNLLGLMEQTYVAPSYASGPPTPVFSENIVVPLHTYICKMHLKPKLGPDDHSPEQNAIGRELGGRGVG